MDGGPCLYYKLTSELIKIMTFVKIVISRHHHSAKKVKPKPSQDVTVLPSFHVSFVKYQNLCIFHLKFT